MWLSGSLIGSEEKKCTEFVAMQLHYMHQQKTWLYSLLYWW